MHEYEVYISTNALLSRKYGTGGGGGGGGLLKRAGGRGGNFF